MGENDNMYMKTKLCILPHWFLSKFNYFSVYDFNL